MRCGLIGEKLGHSHSKTLHGLLADYRYDLIELAPEELPELLFLLPLLFLFELFLLLLLLFFLGVATGALTAESENSLWLVDAPNFPSADRPLRCWKDLSADTVLSPKYPVALRR